MNYVLCYKHVQCINIIWDCIITKARGTVLKHTVVYSKYTTLYLSTAHCA